MSFQTKYWSVDLPENWEGHEGGFSITITKKDGVGLVNFSTAIMGVELPRTNDPKVVLGDDLEHLGKVEEKNYGPFKGIRGELIDKPSLWGRFFNGEKDIFTVKWTLIGGDVLLLASYVCELPSEESSIEEEKGEVESILETLIRV